MIMFDSSKPQEAQGIYVSLAQLIAAEHQAQRCDVDGSFKSRQLFSGMSRSPLRGRGLDFEELKNYQAGDDVKLIDWKVSHRTGRPHVRVYNEEKERKVHLLVDQRASMFFGSLENLKSVSAAMLASLLGWHACSMGDSTAMTVFNDTATTAGPFGRSKRLWLQQLHNLVESNNALSSFVPTAENSLVLALSGLLQSRPRNQLIYIISDFSGLNAEAERALKTLARNNKLKMVLVYDPLEQTFDMSGQLPISDGGRNLILDGNDKEFMAQLSRGFETKIETLERILSQASERYSLLKAPTNVEPWCVLSGRNNVFPAAGAS